MWVPENIGRGKAKITISYPDWKEGKVAPVNWEVAIQEPEQKAPSNKQDQEIEEAEINLLKEKLRNPDAVVRRRAAESLAKLGEKAAPAVMALIDALKDEEVEVRQEVVLALGMIGPKGNAAVPALTAALGEKHFFVRAMVPPSLSQLGPRAKASIPALLKALADEHPAVRTAVVGALAHMGKQYEMEKLVMPALMEVLKGDENVGVRRRAAEGLGLFGKKALSAEAVLRQALQDSDFYVRKAAAEALEKITKK